MRFYVPRPVLALRLVSFFAVPLLVIWLVLMVPPTVSGLVAALVFTVPAVAYVALTLRFSVALTADGLVVRALASHLIPRSQIRAVTQRQRGMRLMVLVDTVEHGWVTLPAPVALSFLQRERYERQYQAILDWWEAGRRAGN